MGDLNPRRYEPAYALCRLDLECSSLRAVWSELLEQLPIDDTLQRFFSGTSLSLPSSFEWTESSTHRKQLVDALDQMEFQVCAHLAVWLNFGTLLAAPSGKQAMQRALAVLTTRMPSAERGQILLGLAGCRSDQHRSLWLFVKHPEIFELAMSIEAPDLLQHELGPGRAINREASAMTLLCDEIHAFYAHTLGPHPTYAAYLHDRQAEPQMLTVSVKTTTAGTGGSRMNVDDHARQNYIAETSIIYMMVNYCERTGIAQTLIRGGYRNHLLLARAFEKYLLRKSKRELAAPQNAGSSSKVIAPTFSLRDAIAAGDGSKTKIPEASARNGPFSEDFRWVHLPDWPHGPIALSLKQAAVLRSMWSFGGKPQVAERIMVRAGSQSDKPMDVFKLKSVNKGDPRYEGPLYAYRKLVQVNRQEGTYAMPCAAT